MVKHIVQKGWYRHAFAQQGQYPGKPAVRLITDIGLFAVNGILTAEKTVPVLFHPFFQCRNSLFPFAAILPRGNGSFRFSNRSMLRRTFGIRPVRHDLLQPFLIHIEYSSFRHNPQGLE